MSSSSTSSSDAPQLVIVQPFDQAAGSGVCDHSRLLCEGLRGRGIAAVVHSLRDAAGHPNAAPLPPAPRLLLQLSIYGYQRRGLPWSLLPLLAGARQRGTWVAVHFHETWVHRAPLLSSARWLAPWQRQLCRRLLLQADLAVFNTLPAWTWGQAQVGTRAVLVPSFSNVGEPAIVPAHELRPRRLVVFGGTAAKTAVYRRLGPALSAMLGRGVLDEVLDIGPPGAARAAGFAVSERGLLPVVEVSGLLLQSRFGAFDTPWGVATKSGVLAAYAAHGVVPVSSWDRPWVHPHPEGVYPAHGLHFLAPADLDRLDETRAAGIARRVQAAYVPRGRLLDLLASLG